MPLAKMFRRILYRRKPYPNEERLCSCLEDHVGHGPAMNPQKQAESKVNQKENATKFLDGP